MISLKNRTKEWLRNYWREYRKKHLAERLAIERRYRYKEGRKAKKSAYCRKYYQLHKDTIRKRFRLDRRANIDKWKAREKFKYAVEVGKIKRLPCEVCGNPKSQGHHEDYSKPLEVRWLCANHHGFTRYKTSNAHS
jgi:hypothetical protein